MNTQDQDHPLNPQAPPIQGNPTEHPQEPARGLFSSALQAGCRDARTRALATAPKLKQAAASAAYEAAYSLAFGAMFAATLARAFLPRSLKSGLAKGAAAGRFAAQQWQPAAPDAVANAI
jgi:hypothetical protein